MADGQSCLIGTPTGDTPAFALMIEDKYFSGALRAHFADTWADALAAGGHALAAPATPLDASHRPQSRDDLRLLRSRARPGPGLLPRPLSTDLDTLLPRLITRADRQILIRTGALRHDGLTRALTDAATRSPDLQLVVIQPAETPSDTWDDGRSTALRDTALASLRAAYGARLACLVDPTASGTLCLIDNRWCLLGSPPLTRRALRVDTHAAALANDTALTSTFSRALAALCLGADTQAPEDAATWQDKGSPRRPADTPQAPSPLPDDLF